MTAKMIVILLVPIHVRGVIKDDLADPSHTPGRLPKVAVLRTRHIITMGGVLSPFLLTFGIGSDVHVNACLGIATIKALCSLSNPVPELVYNEQIGLSLKCPSRRPDPVLQLPPSPVIVPPCILSSALAIHHIHQASGPIRIIPQVVETNSALSVARQCSYGLECPDCALPLLDACSPKGCIHTIAADLISANSISSK